MSEAANYPVEAVRLAYKNGVSEGIRQGVEQERARVRSEFDRMRHHPDYGDDASALVSDFHAWLDAPDTLGEGRNTPRS